jgi:hypothetical protein
MKNTQKIGVYFSPGKLHSLKVFGLDSVEVKEHIKY